VLTETRVIGAKVTVDGAPERAWPARGETARIDWLVVGPDPEPAVGWALAVCVAGSDGTAVSTCDGTPLSTASSADDTVAPAFTFSVPLDLTADRLVVLGVVCPESDPVLDDRGIGNDCTTTTPTRVALTIPVADASRSNDNPALAADAIELDGALLPPFDATGCSVTLPWDHAAHRIHLALHDADRQPLVQSLPGDPTRETLQLSYFTTAGRFEFPFSSVPPDAIDPSAEVTFTLPEGDRAGTIWLYFVLRDLRGGADWAERVVCVEP
jgi:hypothetical protein